MHKVDFQKRTTDKPFVWRVSSSHQPPSEVSPSSSSAVMASPTNNNLIGSSSVDSVTSLANSFLANSHSISSMGSLGPHTGSGLSSVNSETTVDQKSIADSPFIGGSPNTGINIHAELFEVRISFTSLKPTI